MSENGNTDTKAVVQSVAEELREKALGRLTEIREAVGPMIEEEHALVAMVPGEMTQFDTAKQEQSASAPTAPKSSAPKSAPSAPRQRRTSRNGKPTRADDAVKFITENPGSTATEVANSMKIKPNYLYRVLGDLEKEGRIEKDGKTYSVPTAA